MTPGELAGVLVDAFRRALHDLDPASLVRAALPPRPPKRARVRIVAAGKAAIGMTHGAFEAWGDRVEDALIVTDAGDLDVPRCSVLHASHPAPDERSSRAAAEALLRARDLGVNDLLLVLVSGGASALLAAPADGLTLEGKRAIVARLMDSGAPIRHVNTVRRHLSRIKGGRLAQAASPARSLTLVLSDVIGGAPHEVGSGPSVPDPTTIEDAQRVLARYVPSPQLPWSESLKAGAGVRTRAVVVSNPDALATRVAARLKDAGLQAVFEPAEEGAVSEILERRLACARSLRPGHAVAVACEPTLELGPVRGEGGRAGHIALAAMIDLPADVVLLCAATDGVDGSSGSGGAVVSGATGVDRSEVERALASFDDASVHRALGTHLRGGPTGHNLTDLHVLARTPTPTG